MTYDDYTGETLKRCQECRKLKWHQHGLAVCDECKEPETQEDANNGRMLDAELPAQGSSE